MIRPRFALGSTVVLLALAFASGCQEPSTQTLAISAAESPTGPGGEEEFFGEV